MDWRDKLMKAIKVTDRLPVGKTADSHEWHYILMFADGGWEKGYFDLLSKAFQWEDDYDYPDDNEKYDRVTHWMELPEDPE